jgi:hypothetical protein
MLQLQGQGERMDIAGKRLHLTIFSALAVLLATMAWSLPARAEARPGKYRCVKMEAGNQIYPCESPSLILKSDGSYQIWGEYGTYEVMQDKWLVLSHSKRRGLGYLEKSGEIIFEYRVGKRICRVTFERIADPRPGFISG